MIKSSFFGNKDIGSSERKLAREFDGYLSSVEGGEIVSFTSDGMYRSRIRRGGLRCIGGVW